MTPETMWGGPAGMWFMPFFMLFLLVVIILVIGAVVKWVLSPEWGSPRRHGDPTPLDILKIRYAKGEIDKEEFESKKKDLLDLK